MFWCRRGDEYRGSGGQGDFTFVELQAQVLSPWVRVFELSTFGEVHVGRKRTSKSPSLVSGEGRRAAELARCCQSIAKETPCLLGGVLKKGTSC
jgi:hypothetical protein